MVAVIPPSAPHPPALEIDDLINLCGKAKTGPAVLSFIARQCKLSGDPRVASAVCLNPKTPYYASRGLVGMLSLSDLREIAKSPTCPPQLAKDARFAIENKTK